MSHSTKTQVTFLTSVMYYLPKQIVEVYKYNFILQKPVEVKMKNCMKNLGRSLKDSKGHTKNSKGSASEVPEKNSAIESMMQKMRVEL